MRKAVTENADPAPVPSVVLALSSLAQTTQGFATLSLILVSHAAGFALGVGSAGVATFAIGAAIARPVQARCIDRFGASRVLLYCGVAHEAALVAVAVSGAARSSAGLIGAGLCTGLSLPPVSTWQRVHWPRRFASPARAFSTVALLQITAVLVGPLVYGLFAVLTGSQGAATVIAGAIAAMGTVVVAMRARGDVKPPVDAARSSVRRHFAALSWSAAGGVTAGAISVIAPASAIAAGHPSLGSLMVAAETAGGVVGGLVAARVGDRVSAYGLLTVAGCVQAAGAMTLLARPPLAVVAVALMIEGLGLVPTIAAVSALTARRSNGSAEFFGWQSTAQSLGMAGGSALAGAAAEAAAVGGLRASAAVPLACALATVTTAGRARSAARSRT